MKHRKILETLFLGSALLLAVSCNTNRGFKANQQKSIGIGGDCIPGTDGCIDPLAKGKEDAERLLSESEKQLSIAMDLAGQFSESKNEKVSVFGAELEALVKSLVESGEENAEVIRKAVSEKISSVEELGDSTSGVHDMDSSVSLTSVDGTLNFVEQIDSDEVIRASVSIEDAFSTENPSEVFSSVDGQSEDKLVTDSGIAMICQDGIESCKSLSVTLTGEGGIKSSMLFTKTEKGYFPLEVDGKNSLGVSPELGSNEYEGNIKRAFGQEPAKQPEYDGSDIDVVKAGEAAPVKLSTKSLGDRAEEKDGTLPVSGAGKTIKLSDFPEAWFGGTTLNSQKDRTVPMSEINRLILENDYKAYIESGKMTQEEANYSALNEFLSKNPPKVDPMVGHLSH